MGSVEVGRRAGVRMGRCEGWSSVDRRGGQKEAECQGSRLKFESTGCEGVAWLIHSRAMTGRYSWLSEPTRCFSA